MRMRLMTVAFIVLAWTVGCNQQERPNAPTIALDHDAIDFDLDFYAGSYVGTKPQQSLIIRNAGIEPLTLSSVELAGESQFTLQGPITADPDTGDQVDAIGVPITGNHTAALVVFFHVTSARKFTGTLTLHSNSATDPDKVVQISGTGLAPPPDGGQ